jgi:hypothetical protein
VRMCLLLLDDDCVTVVGCVTNMYDVYVCAFLLSG